MLSFRLVFTLVMGSVSACLPTAVEPPGQLLDPTATFRVLFIGNSLTYVNNLPGLVQALANGAGVEKTAVASVAFPDYALEDHWSQGQAVAAIRGDQWDYVIMQQGPSALPESRTNLLEWVPRFAAEIRKAGGTPALYMVWPSTSRAGDFDRVEETYRLASESVMGLLLPAGSAWRAAWRRSPGLALYSPDGLHPSLEGTYLAAVTIFGRLYGRSAAGLPGDISWNGGSIALTAERALLLQSAADEVNGR